MFNLADPAGSMTAYADIAIFGFNCDAIQYTLIRINEQAHAVGLKMNTSKTMVMHSALAPENVAPITLDAVALERIDSLISNTGQGANEIYFAVNGLPSGTL